MKSVFAIVLLQACLCLPLQAQSFGYTITSVNDTSMTFVPNLDLIMTNDTAWLAYTIYEVVSEDSVYISEPFLYTDMTWSTPVTVMGLTPSTAYGMYLQTWFDNWVSPSGTWGATPGNFTTTGPMGLTDVKTELFSFYPNPASDLITIQGDVQDKELVVFDLTGKMLLQKQVNQSSTNLDVSTLSNGAYILSIGNTKKRIIVNH